MNEYHISRDFRERWEEAIKQVQEYQSQILKSPEKENGSCFSVYTCKESMDRIKRELAKIQSDEKGNYLRIIELQKELIDFYENYLLQIEVSVREVMGMVEQLQGKYEEFYKGSVSHE